MVPIRVEAVAEDKSPYKSLAFQSQYPADPRQFHQPHLKL
jgi:hypothetical protein